MLNFEHESLESNESFVFKQLIRVIRVQTLAFAALHAEGAEDGSEDGDDEVDYFLNCFLFHFY